MADLEEVHETIHVPTNTGVEGFLLAIRKILRLPKVQSIHVGMTGRVDIVRMVPPNKPDDLFQASLEDEKLFESVRPGFIIRNTILEEIDASADPTQGIPRLFQRASIHRAFPVAWVSGPTTSFWEWHERTLGFAISGSRDEAYGLPFIYDEMIPSNVLILCTAYERGGAMIDVKRSIKMVMLDTTIRPPALPEQHLETTFPVVEQVEIVPK